MDSGLESHDETQYQGVSFEGSSVARSGRSVGETRILLISGNYDKALVMNDECNPIPSGKYTGQGDTKVSLLYE